CQRSMPSIPALALIAAVVGLTVAQAVHVMRGGLPAGAATSARTCFDLLERIRRTSNAKIYLGRFRNPGNPGHPTPHYNGKCKAKPVVRQVEGNDKLPLRHRGAVSCVQERKRRYLFP